MTIPKSNTCIQVHIDIHKELLKAAIGLFVITPTEGSKLILYANNKVDIFYGINTSDKRFIEIVTHFINEFEIYYF